jgi:RNA polymerase sigma factor (sigma-70 family)
MDIAVGLQKKEARNNASDKGCSEVSSVKNENLSYEELIVPIESRMMQSIWRIVRDPDTAEDTLQEALTIIWRRLDRIRSHPNPHALILKICVNASYDSLRKRFSHLQKEHLDSLDRLPSPSDLNAADALVKKRIRDEILAAVGRLPRKQALAVLMRIVQGEPYDAIAEALGCSEKTARVQVSRGRGRLNRWLSHLIPASSREESK